MNPNYLTSGEFAKLCDTTKVTLRHYKDIGLLVPKHKGENGYLYYDSDQLYDYYAIAVFKQTGTPLAEIHQCMDHQNPASIVEILQKQQEQLQKEKKKIEQMEFIVKNAIENIKLGISDGVNNLTPQVAYFDREHLLAIPRDEFIFNQEELNDEDFMFTAILKKCKETCHQYGIQTDYQLGAVLAARELLDGKVEIQYLYMKVDKPYENTHYREKSSGKYLYVLHKGDWDSSLAYQQLSSYIRENNVQVVGEIYAYDLAGFMINGIEENAMTMVSVQIT